MKAKVICFGSAKGGSGKTIISVSIASFLAALGKKVLLVDVDAATNGLSLFYLDELVKSRRNIIDTGKNPVGIFEARNQLPTSFSVQPLMDIIPATYSIRQTEGVPEQTFEDTLHQLLVQIRDQYDYVLLDAQSGSDIYARIAIESADEIVLVSEFDPISAEGIERLRQLFPRSLELSKTWILFNKILPDFAKSLGDFLSVARYLPPIPWDPDVVRAYVRRKLAIDMVRGNPHTLAILQTLSPLFGEEIAGEVEKWKRDKEYAIREPLREQLQEVEERVAVVQESIIDAEFQMQKAKRRTGNLVTTLVVASTSVLVSLATFFISSGYILQSPTVILITLFPILVLGVTISLYILGFQRRWEVTTKELEGRRRALEEKLEDLRAERVKLKELSDSELSILIKKGR